MERENKFKNYSFFAILLILLAVAVFYSAELNSSARPIVIAGFFIFCGIPRTPYKSGRNIEIISYVVLCEGIVLLFGGIIQMIKIHHESIKDILIALVISLLFLFFGIYLSVLEFHKFNLRKKRCILQVEASYVGYKLVQAKNQFMANHPKELYETPYITVRCIRNLPYELLFLQSSLQLFFCGARTYSNFK